MTDVSTLLTRWVEAGVLDRDTAARLAAYESQRTGQVLDPVPGAPPPVATATATLPPPPGEDGRGGTLAEALGYVGAAIAIGALGLMLGTLWDTLTTGGRLTVSTLVTVVVGGAAIALSRTPSAAIQRLVSVLSVGAAAGVAWTVGLLTSTVLEWRAENVALVVTLAALLVALPAYVLRPRPLTQVALLAALVAFVEALFLRSPLPADALWYLLPVVGIGVAWVLLGVGGWLQPRGVATTFGGVTILLGLQIASFGDHRLAALVLGVAAAIIIVAVAVVANTPSHLAVGALGLFILLPQLVVEVFGDAVGAPATLLIVGILLVLVAVGLGRARRAVIDTEVGR